MTKRVFVYEYISSTNLGRLQSLLREGQAMLFAVLEDFLSMEGFEVVTWLHSTLTLPGHLSQAVVQYTHGEEESTAFKQAAASADFVLVIAPESDGILETRLRWVDECGGRRLGCSPGAVSLTADKLALYRHWQELDLPTPDCRPLPPAGQLDPPWFPAVCKPRFGAGSQSTYLIHHQADLIRHMEHGSDPVVLQRFVPGRAASAAWLLGPGQAVPLLPAEQILSADGCFHYRGGKIPLPQKESERALALSRRGIEAVSGLQGFVGVDLVLGPADDGSEDWLIEINPRLTSSYLGLRQLAETNLARVMVDVVTGNHVQVSWRTGPLEFALPS